MARCFSVRTLCLGLLIALPNALLSQQTKPRARDWGIPFGGTPGPLNAITDVKGIEVGQVTLIEGEGKLERGKGPVRTGVTAVLPRGKKDSDPVFAAWWSLNGNGEMTGTTWVEESGFLWGPVMITNTMSVGVVRDAVIEWAIERGYDDFLWALPVVAETWDGGLNDIDGFHITKQHAFDALDKAAGGPVTEGNIGGGTGMVCHEFKGGIGTSSRKLSAAAGGFTVGVLVQCNYGIRRRLSIAGVPVGQEISDLMPCYVAGPPVETPGPEYPTCGGKATGLIPEDPGAERGSIIIVVATDAPLDARQLGRLALRAGAGLARTGSVYGHGSGDIVLAFSTAYTVPGSVERPMPSVAMLHDGLLDGLFQAAADSTEQAIIHALWQATAVTGRDGNHRASLRDLLPALSLSS